MITTSQMMKRVLALKTTALDKEEQDFLHRMVIRQEKNQTFSPGQIQRLTEIYETRVVAGDSAQEEC